MLIAACASHDAICVTANVRDYRRVPALKVDNWLA
jgi:predicted nucleic acid-binding protein